MYPQFSTSYPSDNGRELDTEIWQDQERIFLKWVSGPPSARGNQKYTFAKKGFTTTLFIVPIYRSMRKKGLAGGAFVFRATDQIISGRRAVEKNQHRKNDDHDMPVMINFHRRLQDFHRI